MEKLTGRPAHSDRYIRDLSYWRERNSYPNQKRDAACIAVLDSLVCTLLLIRMSVIQNLLMTAYAFIAALGIGQVHYVAWRGYA